MASIADNYDINVAKKVDSNDRYGIHFCSIQLDVWNDELAEEKLKFFRNLFGDDYHVTLTHWTCRGETKEGWD